MKAIHQFVAGYSKGDAISNEAVVMQKAFRSWGYESEIFCETKSILPELRKQAHDITKAVQACKPDDVVLLHLSMGSSVNDAFSSLHCKKAILYHNITPPRYFNFINNKTSNDLEKGRRQMRSLAGSAAVNMADSRYNAQELIEHGYGNVKILPLVLDFDKLTSSPDRHILSKYNDDKINVIFVGRCVPNKKLDDAIKVFYYFHRFVQSNSRFIHIGSFAGAERYYYLLLAQVQELGLNCVHFEGSVIQSRLNTYYQCANIFLSMSEHEGFCIPIIESMFYGVPVIAYSAAAVPETMDGAGILVREKKPEAIAEMMGHIVSNQELKNAVIRKQHERVARYRQNDHISCLREYLGPLLAS